MEKHKTNYHEPVLLEECISNLISDKDGIYVDCTMGGAGHSVAILQQLSAKGKVIAIDRDDDAIKFVSTNFFEWINKGQLIIVKNNFKNISEVLASKNILKVNGVLADLGVSAFQIENQDRGFSYLLSGEIDMRMDKQDEISAKNILNSYSEESLSNIFYKYGEEPMSRRIAREVVISRNSKPINETADLVSLIKKLSSGMHVVKILSRIFQALRIEVNKELDALTKLLESLSEVLIPGGRVAIISYHSLEDRAVKQFFVSQSRTIEKSTHKAIPDKIVQPNFLMINKKPITASVEELTLNKKSRSAKLRVAEKI